MGASILLSIVVISLMVWFFNKSDRMHIDNMTKWPIRRTDSSSATGPAKQDAVSTHIQTLPVNQEIQ